jgi:pimeloyl-ACP methyl ester carboxylesterase
VSCSIARFVPLSRPAGVSALLLALACSSVPAHAPATTLVWVQGRPYRLKTSVYRGSWLSPHPVLVIVLHGDAPFNKPDYQDTFAAKVAAANSDVIVAAILRPGYTDPQGNTSEGERGQATGDNYSARNVDALAAAISELRQRFQARRLVVVGHSGGAAITANILGRHPALIDGALLVSCPCDVERWRKHMLQKTGFAGFQGPIATLSPSTRSAQSRTAPQSALSWETRMTWHRRALVKRITLPQQASGSTSNWRS